MKIDLQAVFARHPAAARGTTALKGVSLSLRAGEQLAVIGPSGAGKTTLLQVAAAALKPLRGSVAFDGADPWSLSVRALQRQRGRLFMAPQTPPLPPRQRVVTAVLAGRVGAWGLWRSFGSLAYPSDLPGAREALARLDLADRLFDRCDRLSGGQLQRVGVARVLYQRPDLILADEPVSALDPQLADHTVGELSREAQERGITLVASLHAVDLALKWFPRVVGLRSGAVAFDVATDRVTDEMLRVLYGAETPGIPTQDYLPIEGPGARMRPTQGTPLCR